MTFPIKPSSFTICAGKWNSDIIYWPHPLSLTVDPKVSNSVQWGQGEAWPESLYVTQEHNGSLASRVLNNKIYNLKSVEGSEEALGDFYSWAAGKKKEMGRKALSLSLVAGGAWWSLANWASQGILWGWIINRLDVKDTEAVYDLKYSNFITWYL